MSMTTQPCESTKKHLIQQILHIGEVTKKVIIPTPEANNWEEQKKLFEAYNQSITEYQDKIKQL